MKVKIIKHISEDSTNKTELISGYYKIPKFLFNDEPYKNIDNTARLLYGIYLDRLALCDEKNWIDSEGQKYIIYPQGELTTLLNCSAPTLRNAIKALENLNLIKSCRLDGINQANRIYITTL